MIEIRWGSSHPQAGAMVTLLAPAMASAAASADRLPPGGFADARAPASDLAFAGAVADGSAAAGCSSAAFGGAADVFVLVVLVAGLARLGPQGRAGARRAPSALRRARDWPPASGEDARQRRTGT